MTKVVRDNTGFTESVVEDAGLAWLESLSCAPKHGPEIAPGERQRADNVSESNI